MNFFRVLKKKKTLEDYESDDVNYFTFNGIKTKCKIISFYDGDTCKIILANGDVLMRFNCRLKFLDTPEMKPGKNKINRDIEITNAMRCRNKLIQLVTNCQLSLDYKLTKFQVKKLLNSNNRVIQVQCHEFDKYGRLLAEIVVPGSNIRLHEWLITNKYANPYEGKTKIKFNSTDNPNELHISPHNKRQRKQQEINNNS